MMKSYVITIFDNDKSVESAKRCIESGKRFGQNIEMFPAITPRDNPLDILKAEKVKVAGFKEKYSRLENCVSAFLSHYSLWNVAVNENVRVNIFEHDAVLIDDIPSANFRYVMNFGTPSYGKFNQPRHIGVGPLTTKPYFPGAHAYTVTPEGARRLIACAKKEARPTDVFMNLQTMPWLQEYYPFVAEARDSFSTIQNPDGCLAKHNYNSKYEVINA